MTIGSKPKPFHTLYAIYTYAYFTMSDLIPSIYSYILYTLCGNQFVKIKFAWSIRKEEKLVLLARLPFNCQVFFKTFVTNLIKSLSLNNC